MRCLIRKTVKNNLQILVKAMELDGTAAPGPYCTTNLNESNNKHPNVELVKQEAPEADEIQFELMQQEVYHIKSETGDINQKFTVISSNTCVEAELISNGSWEPKSEMPAYNLSVVSDENIKQELLHQDLDIKTEDETTQETHLHYNYNSGDKLPKNTKIPCKIKSFKCYICDYICEYKSYLKNHYKIHTGEKPFKCDICYYSCGRKWHLKNHLRSHTGEKPFKCNICYLSFTQKCSLQRHVKNHSGEKPFECNICGYRCGENSCLKDHLKTHNNEKPFNCNICKKSLKYKKSLKKHMITHRRKEHLLACP